MTEMTEEMNAEKLGGLTIGRRLTCTVTICGLLVLLCLMFFQIEQHRADLYELASKRDFELTKILSSQVSGSLKWKKTTLIEKSVKNIADGDGSTLASFAAYDKEGNNIFSFDSEQHPLFDFKDAIKEHLSKLDEEIVSYDSEDHLILFAASKDKKGNVVGYISVAWNTHPIAEKISNATTKQGIIVIIALLVLVIVQGYLMFKGVISPLNIITDSMRHLANGDKTIDVPFSERKDEIGSIAKAVQIFKNNALELDNMEREQEVQRQRAEEEKVTMMNNLADSFESRIQVIIDSTTSAATEFEVISLSLKELVDSVNSKATSAQSSSKSTLENVNVVAAASEELTASISEISQQTINANNAASDAGDKANNASEITSSLQQEANKIGEVVKLISDIAEQTNLLALNATIEAARAGDAGKGFAVVASEVKNLAEQTAKATENITNQILSVQNVASEVVEVVEVINQSITNVSEFAGAISAAVEEQSVTTVEISSSMGVAAQGVSNINTNLEDMMDSSKASSESSETLLAASKGLSAQAENLSREVADFLSEIRAT